MSRSHMEELQKAARLVRGSSFGEVLSDAGFLANVKLYQSTHQYTGEAKEGVNFFELDWDVLVILDACRLDLMRNVAHEYDYIDEVGSVRSLGSHSREWMERTFTPAYTHYMKNTVHVTGNPFSDTVLSDESFAALDEVWRYAWDSNLGTLPARPVTDRAIQHWRQSNPDSMIVHYIQPHAPFVSAPNLGDGMDTDDWGGLNRDEVWRNLRLGRVSYPDVLDGYEQNLRYVLDEVSLLRDNIDAGTVAITADHGNAMGEQSMYGHPYGVAVDVLRDVPWVTTTATATDDYQPDTVKTKTEDDEQGVAEGKLEDLGYL